VQKKYVVGIIASIIIFSLAIAMATNSADTKTAKKGDAIGVIYIEGVITGSRDEAGFLGVGVGSRSLLEQLKEAREDDSIKAVLIRINSPGGSAAASQEIGNEIEKIRKTGKKVVTSMGDTAASGGYWIAATTDRIVANPATLTGSIGVIMDLQNMQELFKKIGITPQTIKSGPFKDIGSPTRPLTPAEKEILQGMVDDIYQQFVDVVVKGRKMDRAKVLQLADGRIFTGRQAKDKGLVDELGNFSDAVSITARLAKIQGEPELKELNPQNPFEILFTGMNSILFKKELQALQEILKYQPLLENR
jgi:protease-4